MSQAQKSAAPRRPNKLVRAVAGLGISIRGKLVISFAGITALMIGLALLGLATLGQANDRTEQLLRDHERIALFRDFESRMNRLSMLAFAAASISPEASRGPSGSWREAPAGSLVGLVDYLHRAVGQATRRFGGPGSPDQARLQVFRDGLNRLAPISRRIKELREKGDLDAVNRLAVTEFEPIAEKLRHNSFRFIRAIEAEMENRAQQTSAAYAASRKTVLAAAYVAVGVALLLGYTLSSSLIWPLHRIGRTLNAISSGDFGARASVPNRDEFGSLAGDVNAMGRELGDLYAEVDAQRRELADWNTALEDRVLTQIRQIERTGRLRRFLPAQVADMIIAADDDDTLLGSRRAHVTVLFADLRGFTAYAAAMPAERVIAALNAFHTVCGPLIDAQGGTLERFLGDGLMVLFNAPAEVADPEHKAVKLAANMQRAFPAAMQPFQQGDTRLGLGIGISSGLATLGNIGFEGRLDYAAIGAVPNLAARLCDQAGPGDILVCETVARKVSAPMCPAGPFDLKGIGIQVPAFEVDMCAEGL